VALGVGSASAATLARVLETLGATALGGRRLELAGAVAVSIEPCASGVAGPAWMELERADRSRLRLGLGRVDARGGW
jgi:hypothetical protein